MNALANSQQQELTKFLCHGYPEGKGPVTFRRYTGQEKDEERQEILANPPDILLTNYVMLELILTRVDERQLVQAAQGLRFLVLDELHTYRGRQGADVALLVRRTREACAATQLQHVGTSATIGETLRRTTKEPDTSSTAFRSALNRRLADSAAQPPEAYEAFVADPLSQWIESSFGVTTEAITGRLVRAQPRTISGPDGGAAELAALADVSEERCRAAIQEQLLAGYRVRQPDTGFPVFAFRLHQFISRGDAAFATVEPEDKRFITVHPQKYVPEDRTRLLFPLTFCRECGQEYYTVRLLTDDAGPRLEPREFDEKPTEDGPKVGYLYARADEPWAYSPEKLPEDWLEAGDPPRVKYHLRSQIPEEIIVAPDGGVGGDGMKAHFIPAPFRFCLQCRVAYGGRARSDFPKLGTLGSEGRSTATTILGLSTVRHLNEFPPNDLAKEARKLLSFTDNRQDASLQAGHFNDFVQVGLLRSALYRAAQKAGPTGLTHEVLTQRVFDALNLPLDQYATDSTVKFAALQQTQKALRDVIGYRLYLDLRRGWRITSPNLEQTGLLRIEYESLDEVAADTDTWKACHAALVTARPESEGGGRPRTARLPEARAGDQGRLPRLQLPGAAESDLQPEAAVALGARRERELLVRHDRLAAVEGGKRVRWVDLPLASRRPGRVPAPQEHVPGLRAEADACRYRSHYSPASGVPPRGRPRRKGEGGEGA
jgi:hypothetical protein